MPLCSPNAHTRPIVLLERRCSSKRARGATHPWLDYTRLKMERGSKQVENKWCAVLDSLLPHRIYMLTFLHRG